MLGTVLEDSHTQRTRFAKVIPVCPAMLDAQDPQGTARHSQWFPWVLLLAWDTPCFPDHSASRPMVCLGAALDAVVREGVCVSTLSLMIRGRTFSQTSAPEVEVLFRGSLHGSPVTEAAGQSQAVVTHWVLLWTGKVLLLEGNRGRPGASGCCHVTKTTRPLC